MFAFKYGIQLDNKSINQSHPSITDVRIFSFLESQVALCVYDITNKESFQVMKNWVDELQSKGPEGLRIVYLKHSFGRSWQ